MGVGFTAHARRDIAWVWVLLHVAGGTSRGCGFTRHARRNIAQVRVLLHVPGGDIAWVCHGSWVISRAGRPIIATAIWSRALLLRSPTIGRGSTVGVPFPVLRGDLTG